MTAPEALGRPPRSATLARIVERFWYVADSRQRGHELKLPSTTAQIVINLDADWLTTRPIDSHPDAVVTAGSTGIAPIATAAAAVVLDRQQQRRTAGIVIRPEAIRTVAGVTAESLPVLVDLEQLWGSAAQRLAEAAASAATGPEVLDRLEARLAGMLRGRRNPDPICHVAIGQLRRGTPVAAIAESLGLSQSSLTRRFRAAVGMTPKRFQRLLRMEQAIGVAAGGTAPDWAAIATQCGYYDQPHLAHEFSELTGLTPTRWQQSLTGNPFHITVDADFLQDTMAAVPAV